METTCHYGSTGLSLLPWPCPGHINPSDRIARTCPSFWVSIYTTWQSLWPSLTQGSKRERKKEKKKREVILVTLARVDETEYFHWFVVLAHFHCSARQGNALECQQKAARVSKYQGRETLSSLFVCLAWFPIIERYYYRKAAKQGEKKPKLKGFDEKRPWHGKSWSADLCIWPPSICFHRQFHNSQANI